MVNVETVTLEPSNDVGHDQIDRFRAQFAINTSSPQVFLQEFFRNSEAKSHGVGNDS